MKPWLGKVTPIALLLGMVGYCCWPYLAGLGIGTAAEGRGKLPEVTAAMLRPALGAPAARDPFALPQAARAAVTAKPLAGPAVKAADTGADTAKLLGRLALHATYIHGQRRVAVINGEVYAEGEPLRADGATAAPFVVGSICPHKVLLRHLDETVELCYSDKNPAAGQARPAGAGGAGRGKTKQQIRGRRGDPRGPRSQTDREVP